MTHRSAQYFLQLFIIHIYAPLNIVQSLLTAGFMVLTLVFFDYIDHLYGFLTAGELVT